MTEYDLIEDYVLKRQIQEFYGLDNLKTNSYCNHYENYNSYFIKLGNSEEIFYDGGELISKDLAMDAIKKLNNYIANYDRIYNNAIEEDKGKISTFFKKFPHEYKKIRNAIYKEDKPPVRANDYIGQVYIMKNCGYFKIGKAKIGSTRFGEYTKLPEEPEYIIISKVFDYGEVEKTLHNMFKKKRLREGECEWFNLNNTDLDIAIKYIKQNSTYNAE